MAAAEGRSGYDPNFDAEVRMSARTVRHLRHLALINSIVVAVLMIAGLLIYLRLDRLPDLDGRSAVHMSRIDLELMLFKGYSAKQLFIDPSASPKTCSWLERGACGATYALKGDNHSYRCVIERDRWGTCTISYTCRPFRC